LQSKTVKIPLREFRGFTIPIYPKMDALEMFFSRKLLNLTIKLKYRYNLSFSIGLFFNEVIFKISC